ncbi:MAG TPA: hypothetical protein VEA80_04960 [Vitreimonas sp.]|uniref:hypothetical protein n=1 Tax=Vitreimonas sp. TaxID=3069702 RepID=UPI002D2260C7|nr:hypothetical protein [Vitreimonas sp.]HYD86802.1 hypothetical protein [Vitreimonas sp.]
MSFGKRPSTPPQMSAPPARAADPHGRRKVFPDEIWQGQTGELLRQLGFSPDDESNLVPNAASVNARMEHGRALMEARHAQAQRNAQAAVAGARLRPFYLIPDPCWNGATGVFLKMTLELYPYDDWNVMFLAANERTAYMLDIAPHPDGNVPGFVASAEKFMADALALMNEAHEEASRTNDFAAYEHARDDLRARVKVLAGTFAREVVQTWERRREAERV